MRKKKMPNIYIRQYQEFKEKPSLVRKPFVIAFALIVVLSAGAMAYIYKDMWIKKPQQLVAIVQKETVSIYLPTGHGKLIEKKIDITSNLKDKEKGDLIIRNLKTFKSIPEDLILNDLVIDSDGILYLNFAKNISDKKTASMTEIMKTFSIVNSFLGSFRNTNKVQFLVEGQPVYTLNGTVYTYKPLEFNQDLLED
jgi:spore germination protein GerM